MCFSAGASFSAGVVLSVIGVVSIKKTQSSGQFFFASIPLVFAIQQFSEGLLWIALADPVNVSLRHYMTFIFLLFAQVVWPIWVPFAILKMEPKESRRFAGRVFVGIGALVSAYLFYCLIAFKVDASAVGKHIMYEQYYPISVGKACGILYVLATIGPPFISRLPRMWMLGISILISYVITTFFYTDYIVSVWCFFASIISIAVYAIINEHSNMRSVISKSNNEPISI